MQDRKEQGEHIQQVMQQNTMLKDRRVDGHQSIIDQSDDRNNTEAVEQGQQNGGHNNKSWKEKEAVQQMQKLGIPHQQ